VSQPPTTAESATRRRTRQAIIEAAVAVLVARRDATLADIADAAETSRSTLHRHFTDRSDLVQAVVLDSIEAITTATVRAAVEEGPPPDAMRRLVAAYLDVGDRIRFLFDDPALMADHPVIGEFAGAEGPVVGLIERGQADGSFTTALRPDWIERVLWSLVYAAAEAVDDGSLGRHEALSTVLRTMEEGVRADRAV
jgi:AcrR family transcriptional regulator